jgi:Ca2+-binding RTX toxin-like protein
MALTLNYTTTSSDLPAFLQDWQAEFAYRGDGNFNSVYDTSDQWFAGTPGSTNGASSVIVNGHDFSHTSGVVDGTVNTLELGSDVAYNPATDTWHQNQGLSIDFNGASLTSTWNNAVTDLAHNGSLSGLEAYFAEQGTIQNGTSGNDTLLSFAGNDVLTGGAGADRFDFAGKVGHDEVTDFNPHQGDIIDLSGISWINNYVDLLTHSNILSGLNHDLVLSNGTDTITFDNYKVGHILLDGLTGAFDYA